MRTVGSTKKALGVDILLTLLVLLKKWPTGIPNYVMTTLMIEFNKLFSVCFFFPNFMTHAEFLDGWKQARKIVFIQR